MTECFYVQVINVPLLFGLREHTEFQLVYDTEHASASLLGTRTAAIWYADDDGKPLPNRRRVSDALASALTGVMAVCGDDLDRIVIRNNGDLRPILKSQTGPQRVVLF